MKQFKGIFPAIVTPFRADESIDFQALQTLVERNLAQGVSGFYVSGTTGESFLMSDEERIQLIEAVCGIVNGRCDVIANVGTFSTRRSIEIAQAAVRSGAAAVSAVPPFYFPYSKQEIQNYYLELARGAGTGVVIYNIPKMSGVGFSTQELLELLAHPEVVGIKQTTYDLYQTETLLRSCGQKTVFNGHDEILIPALSAGAKAAIGSTFGIIPDVYLSLIRHFEAGELDRARALQGKANAFLDVLLSIGIFKAIKAVLKIQGLDCGDCRKPFEAVDRAQYQQLEAALLELYKDGID